MLMQQKKEALQRNQAAQNNLNTMGQQGQGRGQVPTAPQAPMANLHTTQAPGSQAIPNPKLFGGQQGNLGPRQTSVSQSVDPQASTGQPNRNQVALTDAQAQQMDGVSYPDNLLNNNSTLSRLPEHVKSWGQLKEWVASNVQTLPPDSLHKVKQLQAKHYQMVMIHERTRLMNQGQAGNVTQQGPRPAPPAPMSTNATAQQPTPGQNPGQAGPMPFPQIPPPTMQEVQSVRASLQGQSHVLSDEQIKMMIMRKKQQIMLQNRQNAQQQNLQTTAGQDPQAAQQRYTSILQAQQAQQNRAQALQPPQMQPQPLGQVPPQQAQQWAQQQGRIQAEQAMKNQANHVGQRATPKGVKRSNNDDVVEVPDPKLSQQQQHQARPPTTQGQPPNQTPSMPPDFTPQQLAAMNPQQRQQLEAHRRIIMAQQAQQAQANQQRGLSIQQHDQSIQGQPSIDFITNTGNQQDPRVIKVRQLRDEVTRTMPPRRALPMSPKTRGQMINQLKNSKDILGRIDQSLAMYLAATQNQERVKEVIRLVCFTLLISDTKANNHQRMLLVNQVRDTDYNPVENFTMSFEELKQALSQLQHYAVEVQQVFTQAKAAQQSKNQAQQPQAPKAPTQPQPTPQPPQSTPLNFANLQQQQEALREKRALSLAKPKGNNNPPAAPTTSQNPFSFGSQSPQGVPQIYVPKKNELTQEKLVLPNKKRKGNQAGSPAIAQPLPGTHVASAANKVSPEAQRTPVAPMFRCKAPNCQHPAFGSKEMLDKHTKEAHEIKEEKITDPLEFALQSLRDVLNLDDEGKSRPVEAKGPESLQATSMKTTASSQGMKKEVAGTPTSKTVAGLKTPQTKVSTPTSTKEATLPTSAPATQQQDPWTQSHLPANWFKDVFRDVANPNRALSTDFLTTWLEAQPHEDSPTSTDTDKNSPHKSDISANDNLNINIVDEDGGFLPADWFDPGVEGGMEALDMQTLDGMDWEAAFGKAEVPPILKDEDGPSDEWLKVWAPEKYKEKVKKEKRRV